MHKNIGNDERNISFDISQSGEMVTTMYVKQFGRNKYDHLSIRLTKDEVKEFKKFFVETK
jgi:hypothetical protein